MAFLFTAVLALSAVPAFAGPRISVVGSGSMAKITASGTQTISDHKSKLAYGGGALVEFRLGGRTGLELGALYYMRAVEFTAGTIAMTMTSIHAPVSFNYWFNRVVSISLGGFFNNALGKLKFEPGGEQDYSALSQKKTDFGALGGLRFNIPLGASAGLRLEGRYLYGLSNLDDPAVAGGSTKMADIQMFAGLTFGGMK
jgi:hypothetical protein